MYHRRRVANVQAWSLPGAGKVPGTFPVVLKDASSVNTSGHLTDEATERI
jgi:hypothetical protein